MNIEPLLFFAGALAPPGTAHCPRRRRRARHQARVAVLYAVAAMSSSISSAVNLRPVAPAIVDGHRIPNGLDVDRRLDATATALPRFDMGTTWRRPPALCASPRTRFQPTWRRSTPNCCHFDSGLRWDSLALRRSSRHGALERDLGPGGRWSRSLRLAPREESERVCQRQASPLTWLGAYMVLVSGSQIVIFARRAAAAMSCSEHALHAAVALAASGALLLAIEGRPLVLAVW